MMLDWLFVIVLQPGNDGYDSGVSVGIPVFHGNSPVSILFQYGNFPTGAAEQFSTE